MSHRDDAGASPWPAGPTGDLLLAQALEACLRAERAAPGSAERIIARQPRAAQSELRQLVQLARSLESSMTGVGPSAEFTRSARARLLHRIGHDQTIPLPVVLGALPPRRRRRWKWMLRTSAGLLAAVLATAATLTASASALPGDPLYGLKQAQEDLSVRLAADDQARVLTLLRNADARLDETQRLLQQGRTSEAVETAQRYDQSVERATTALVVTLAPGDQSGRFDPMENKLGEQQQRLESIIQTAPEPARPDLREALATTARGRELVADPQPVERALGLRQPRPVAAAPAAHTEDLATRVPTKQPTAAPSSTPLPSPTVIVAESQQDQDEEMAAEPADARAGEDSQSAEVRAQAPQVGNRGRGSGSSQAAVSSSHNDEGNRDAEGVVAVQALSQGGQDGEDRGNGQAEEQDRGRGHDNGEDKQDQPVVARQSQNPPAAVDNRGSAASSNNGSSQGHGQGRDNNDNSSSSGSASARSNAVQPASQSDKSGAAVARDSRDDAKPASSVGSAKPAATPTPTPRRTVSADDQKSGNGSGSGNSHGNGSSGSGNSGGSGKSDKAADNEDDH